jgi:outer membrane protein assembly factor BamB
MLPHHHAPLLAHGDLRMATDVSVTLSTEETAAQKMRWWPAWAAVGLGVVLQVAAAFAFAENLTYLAFGSLFIIWPLTVFLLLIWWTFLSRLPWATRGIGWLAVLASFVGFVSVFRFDEFDGAMLPRFSFRWTPTANARAEEFFRQQSTNKNAIATGRLTSEESSGALTDTSPTAEDSLVPTDQDSPGFRGLLRDGVAVGVTLRTDWDARPPKLLWRHPIGQGWGSFAVIGRRAWTIEQRGAEELVVCYDIKTGDELWSHVDRVRFESVQGGIGPRSTPTVHEGKVFSLGGTGILNCLDAATGQHEWSRNILDDAGSQNLPWGQAGSPLVVDDLVIVSPGSNDAASKAQHSAVLAYHRQSGEKAWAMGDRKGSYVSPHLTSLRGRRQVLIFDGAGLQALSPEDGQRLWDFAWQNSQLINAAQPLVVDDHTVLIGSGYGQGAALLDVTHSDGGWAAKQVWKSKQFKLKFNGAVQFGQYLYGLDEGLLTCLSLRDGQRRWKQGRYGYGQMLLVEDKLLILSEDGDVVLVPASPESPREIARFHAIDGKTWNHPVLSRGRLLVRNAEEAACYDLRPSGAEAVTGNVL